MKIELEIGDNFYGGDSFGDMRPGEVYVDVGAYDGDTVEATLKNCPGLKVVAIEPIAALCVEIRRKFPDNKKIKVMNKACWNEKGTLMFNEYVGWGRGLSTVKPSMTQLRPIPAFGTGLSQYMVEADTLDNILTDCGIEVVDYLKVDTEGSEEEVLLGFTKYHSGTRFHIEFHMVNLANILQTLMEKGARIERVTMSRDPNVNSHIIGAIVGGF